MFLNNKANLMKKVVLPLFAVTMVILATQTTWAQTTPDEQTTVIPPPATAAEPAAGQQLDAIISNMTGTAVQVSLDEGKTWQAAKQGMALSKGAAVRTGFASTCEINFGDHSILQIMALSSVSITEYAGSSQTTEKVQTNLQYGAVRCGVEKGRVETDTKISTPVSTLSIRGTFIYVEYDPGTRRCTLKVDEDGPAVASTFTRDCFGLSMYGDYMLNEGMKTDCCLSRFLKLAIFERTVWVTGNLAVGDITDAESNTYVYKKFFGGSDPTGGALSYNSDRSRNNQVVTDIIISGGGTPIGNTGPGSNGSIDSTISSTLKNRK
ncbi:MAG: hypothetical protein GY869_23215 [Planctomycetes bacterium]|nr:hypothetical protein [Planctomycetota bacterium]